MGWQDTIFALLYESTDILTLHIGSIIQLFLIVDIHNLHSPAVGMLFGLDLEF